jgi:hypothetical protein
LRRECLPGVKRVALVRSATGDRSVAATGLFLVARGGIWEATQGGLARILKAEL